jgi:uncharacterized protein (DUF4213/DUF364 family)
MQEGEVVEVRIGLRWTAVVVRVDGQLRCGLSSTLDTTHSHGGKPGVPQAGVLQTWSGHKLAELAKQAERPTLSCVGVAAINALLPDPAPEEWIHGNAEGLLLELGSGKRIAIVGRFPFVEKLNRIADELFVFDQHPVEGEYPPEAAPEILPTVDIAAITGMALANHTMEPLLSLCEPGTRTIVLGPSTPFSPVMFTYGVDFLSGSIVNRIEPVLQTVSQGGNFRQVHRAGVKLVTIARPNGLT